MKTPKLLFQLAVGISAVLALPSVSEAATFDVVATFDYPGFTSIGPYKINDDGYVAGTVDSQMGALYGFVRSPSGQLSELIVDPEGYSTGVYGINNLRQLCGVYEGGRHGDDGFISTGRKFITKDYPGAFYTQIYALNDAGSFCGIHNNEHGYSGFVNINHIYSSFKIPGSGFTYAFGINNLNQTVGYYSNDIESHSFFRDSDGTLTYPIDAPGGAIVGLSGINDAGRTVGGIVNATGSSSGVVFLSPSEIATYDYPGADYTVFLGINNTGLICGVYADANGTHGLIVRLTE